MQEKTADKIRGYIFTLRSAHVILFFIKQTEKFSIKFPESLPLNLQENHYIKPFLLFFYFFCLIQVFYYK